MPRGRKKKLPLDPKVVRDIDDLAELDRLKADVFPIIRKAREEGWTAERLWSDPRVLALMSQKMLLVAMTTKDDRTFQSGFKEIVDRAKGKPTERHEHKHELENLSDQELDALIITQMGSDSDRETLDN